MERRKTVLMASFALFIIICAAGDVFAGGKILFYQAKTGGNYRLAGDYSKLADSLHSAGYEVDELKADLTIENLNTLKADIIIIPALGSDLTESEMTTLFEFVIKDGKGVVLMGATPATNRMTIPLGIRALDETLEDDNNKIRDASTGQLVDDKKQFFIDLPPNRPDTVVNSLTRGVNTLYIFTATGLHLFGNAKGVIYGGDATNTPISLVFPKGSNPPLAAYTRLGSGSIVLINDPDMFTNVNIDPTKYRNDNVKFAVNIMDWLSTPFQDQLTDQEVDNIMKSLKTQVTDDNRTIVSLQAQTDSLNQQITTLSSEKEGLTSELAKYRSDKVMGLPWLTYSSLAMFVLAGAFLLTCVVVMKKGRKKPEKKEGQGGELGYEFDEKTDEENAAEGDEEVKTAGKIKEEDVEERLRELQKTSK